MSVISLPSPWLLFAPQALAERQTSRTSTSSETPPDRLGQRGHCPRSLLVRPEVLARSQPQPAEP
jgi:hypothetical protein